MNNAKVSGTRPGIVTGELSLKSSMEIMRKDTFWRLRGIKENALWLYEHLSKNPYIEEEIHALRFCFCDSEFSILTLC